MDGPAGRVTEPRHRSRGPVRRRARLREPARFTHRVLPARPDRARPAVVRSGRLRAANGVRLGATSQDVAEQIDAGAAVLGRAQIDRGDRRIAAAGGGAVHARSDQEVLAGKVAEGSRRVQYTGGGTVGTADHRVDRRGDGEQRASGLRCPCRGGREGHSTYRHRHFVGCAPRRGRRPQRFGPGGGAFGGQQRGTASAAVPPS